MPHTLASSTLWDADQRAVIALEATASGVVIGAPGSGKTRAAIERARVLLESKQIAADELILLTPSRQSATSIRDLLGLQVSVATPGALARSVGSFAFQVVRAASSWAGQSAPQLLTGADQDRLIAELLAGDEEDATNGSGRWPEELLPAAARASQVFRSELRAFMSECTQRSVDADELGAIATQQDNPVWAAIASFSRDYRAVLASMRSAHRESAELLTEATAILRSATSAAPELGSLGKLRVVIVDDAQELTMGGIDLVCELHRRGVAVLAFGDPDIGSGSFRGATPQLFATLAATLGTVHVFENAHRQNLNLLHVTRSVTQGIGAAGRVDHRRAPGIAPEDDGSVVVRFSDSPFAEADVIARTLREWHVLEGIAWQDMAVLAHDTRQVAALETELAAREVPTRAAGIQRPLGQESAVRDIIRVLTVAMTDPAKWDGEELATVLLSPFGGLDAVGLRRLRARLRHRELTDGGSVSAVTLLAQAMAHPLELSFIDTPEARTAERLATVLRAARESFIRGDTVHDLLWLVWDKARIFGRPLAEFWREQSAGTGAAAAEAARALDALVALFDAAKRSIERAPEAGPELFIDELIGSDVPEDSLASPLRAGTVTLMTPATALGAEYEAVVIAGVQDGIWPNVRLRGTLLDTWMLADVIDAHRAGEAELVPTPATDRRRMAVHDELRLFVRAVSRARSKLLVSAVNDDDAGPSALFSFLPAPTPQEQSNEHPLTLRGLIAQHRRTLTSTAPVEEAERERAAAELALLAAEGITAADPLQWYGVAARSSLAPLRDAHSVPVSVSPSRLDGLETCAVDWAVRSLGGNTSTFSTGLGTILHAAMEEVPSGNIDDLEKIVWSRWGELNFEADWLSEKEKRWASTLIERISAYVKNFHKNEGTRLGAEAEFEVVIPFGAHNVDDIHVRAEDEEVILPAAILRGSIDRVESYPAEKGELVPFDESRPGQDRVVIVDLKTGKGEMRVSDDKVTDDAQLAAYQLAVRAGGVHGVDPNSAAGARLVIISKELPSKGMRYRIAHQPRLDDAQQSAFIARVVEGAKLMASDTFAAPVDTHCNHERFAVCRIHTVGAVSAS